MPDDTPRHSTDDDAELERKIRSERKFSLSDAIGRLAGSGMMKGISPVTRTRQAEALIKEYLDRHIGDAEGVLPAVLLRQIVQSELLLSNLDAPLDALASHLEQVLNSEYRLSELVREADVEWGRLYAQRPYFEREDRPSHPDDPYTITRVRAALRDLLGELKK